MASKKISTHQSLALLLFSLLTLSSASAQAKGGIAVYWGQNNDAEGSLMSACDTGNYEIVLLAFLNQFGCDRTPALNFTSHCGSAPSCTTLQSEIEHCQQMGVKVFLSLGGPVGQYSLCKSSDVGKVSDYLYHSFLNGEEGPLGTVALDGIDFDIEFGSNLYWDNLAKELNIHRQRDRYFLLSASPRCEFPDGYLDTAIKTGLFDYIFVKFYDSPTCQYDNKDRDTSELMNSWNKWTSYVKSNDATQMFLGIPAGPDAAPKGGYIPPSDLCSWVLPGVEHSSNYGGVVLWNRFQDVKIDYSNQIIKKNCVGGAGDIIMVSQM